MFIVFWGCALSGPSCQKKRTFGHPPKKKISTDNSKAHFFGIFGLSCYFYFSFFCFSGHITWPSNPPFCFLFCFSFCVFLEGLRVRWGGPKGHLTWPLTFFCVSFFLFISFLLLVHENRNMKLLNFKVFLINPFSYLVSCLVFSFKSLSLVFVFPDFDLCFLFNINVFAFKKRQVLKNTNFWKKGVAT